MTEESSSNLLSFTSSSSSQTAPPSIPTIVSSSSSNGLHQSGGVGLTHNGTNIAISAAASRTAPQITTASGTELGLEHKSQLGSIFQISCLILVVSLKFKSNNLVAFDF